MSTTFSASIFDNRPRATAPSLFEYLRKKYEKEFGTVVDPAVLGFIDFAHRHLRENPVARIDYGYTPFGIILKDSTVVIVGEDSLLPAPDVSVQYYSV